MLRDNVCMAAAPNTRLCLLCDAHGFARVQPYRYAFV